jgi:hypothetical protein
MALMGETLDKDEFYESVLNLVKILPIVERQKLLNYG